jgi:hypothetical protein
MAQRFLSIANFEKYQRDSKRTYPWVPLYKKLLINPDFLKLDVNSRYIYVCLILIGSDCGNKIPNDVSYLAHRCSIDVSLLNLKPLYRYGFLQASKTTKWRLERHEKGLRNPVLEDTAAEPRKPQLSRRDKLELFELTDQDRCWAKEELGILNPDDYIPEFKDYWRAIEDKKLKSDWVATFRNRLRYLKDHNQLKQSVW